MKIKNIAQGIKIIALSAIFSIYNITNAQQRIATYGVEKTANWVCKIYTTPFEMRQYTFNNGLTVILARNTSMPTIDTRIAVKAGSKNDPADATGLAHYLEHMLFKGTDKYGSLDYEKEKIWLARIDSLYEVYNKTIIEAKRKQIYAEIDSFSKIASQYAIANEYDKMMQGIGATGTNAYTSVEQTVYVNTIPTNVMHKWIEIEAERFRNPILRLFHTELEAVYEEKNISLDNDYSKVFEKMDAMLFKKHPYGTQTTIGTIEHLKNPSLIKIRNYYSKYYVPNNMAIIMAGDLGFDTTINMILTHFGSMKMKQIPAFDFAIEYPGSTPQKAEISGKTEPSVWVGYRLPGTNTKESIMAEMVDMLLNNSVAGLFDLKLVKAQKVLNANSYINGMKDYSIHYLFGNPKENQSLQEVEKLLKSQLDSLRNGKFSDNLLKSILLDNKISRIKRYESNSGIIADLTDAFIYDIEWMSFYNRGYIQTSFSKKDIVEFINEYYTQDHAVIYKKQGKPDKSVSIDKPKITPVELNRDKTSAFVNQVMEQYSSPIMPQFTDIKSEIIKESVGKAPLWYIKNKRNELFNLYYVLDLGKLNDKLLPLAINYLKYVGTTDKNADAVANEFYSLGSSFSVFSGETESYIYLSGIQENFNVSVNLFETLLQNPNVNEEAFKSMIADLKTERANNKTEKNYISSALRNYAMFGKENPFNYNLSNAELDKLTATQLIDLIKKLLKFQHTIMYYGPEDIAKIKASLTLSHILPTDWMPVPAKKVFTKIANSSTNIYFAQYDDMVQAQISWYKRANQFDVKQMAISNVHGNYFGGGMSGVVFQTIRESKSLAYSSYSNFNMANEKGEYNTVLSYIGTQSDKMKDAINAMNELHINMPLDSTNLKLAKSALITEMNTDRKEGVNVFFFNKSLEKMGLKENYKPEMYAMIDKISVVDIQKFHSAQYSQTPFNYCIVADKNKVDMVYLKKLGNIVELDLTALFGY